MKRFLVIPLLLIFGLLVIGCPSDPDPPITIGQGNIILSYRNGTVRYLYSVTDFQFEEGTQYIATLDVEAIDEIATLGMYSGVLVYLDGGVYEEVCDSELVGPISLEPGEYTWGFTANKDTPAGAPQYFLLVAKDEAQEDFTDPLTVFNIRGTIEVREMEALELSHSMSPVEATPKTSQSYSIEETEFQRLKAISNKSKCILRVYFNTATGGDQVKYGSPGDIGKIGPDKGGGDGKKDGHFYIMPGFFSDTKPVRYLPEGGGKGYNDFTLSELFRINGTYNYIQINLFSSTNSTFRKAELWVPK